MVRKSVLPNVGETQEDDAVTVESIDMNTGSAPTHEHAPAQAGDENDEPEELSNISEDEHERQTKRERTALLKDVAKIGEAYGAGRASMINLAERVTEAAMTPSIGIKDAEEIYDRFRKRADDKATLDDAGLVPDAAFAAPEKGNASRDQQLTKLRAFIKFGNEYQEEALDTIRTARNVHIRMLAGDRDTVKKGSTYTHMTAIATEHIKKDNKRKGVPMSEAEIEEYLTVTPKESEPATPLKKLMDALNSAIAARKGGRERAPIDHPALNAAIENLQEAVGDQTGGPEELAKQAAKREKKEEQALASN